MGRPSKQDKIVSEFFYNNYQRTWPGATLQQMQYVYFHEFDWLLKSLQDNRPYYQEFARDYRLATELRSKISPEVLKTWEQPSDARSLAPFYVAPTVNEQPYTIMLTPDGVLFKYYTEEVLLLGYSKFFDYLEFYAKLLEKTFPNEFEQANLERNRKIRYYSAELANPNRTAFARKQDEIALQVAQSQYDWHNRISELRSRQWHKLFDKVSSKLMFWKSNKVPGDPNAIFTDSRKVALKPGALLSFKQLDSATTLNSLTADALTDYQDLDVLQNYTNLRSLALRHMHVKDISFVANLTNLDELILANNDIEDISPIAYLPKLTHLYLVGNPIKDLSVLETLPRLRNVFIDVDQVPPDLKRMRINGTITVLKYKFIESEKLPNGGIIPNWSTELVETIQLHCKRKSRNVATLNSQNATGSNQNTLASNNSAASKPAVKAKPDWRKLDIKDRYLYSGLFNSLGYTAAVVFDIQKLKKLDCSNGIALQPDHTFLNEPGDFSCLNHASNLRKLNLSDRYVKDFSFLSKCNNLTHLNLSRSNIKELSLLHNLKSLRSLDISGCTQLSLTQQDLLWLPTVPDLFLDFNQITLIADSALTIFVGLNHDYGGTVVLRNAFTPKEQGMTDSYEPDREESFSHSKLTEQLNEERFEKNLATLKAQDITPPDFGIVYSPFNHLGLRTYFQFLMLVQNWTGTIDCPVANSSVQTTSDNLVQTPLSDNLAQPTSDNLAQTPQVAQSPQKTTKIQWWLLNAQNVLDHPMEYPWQKEFTAYGIAKTKFQEEFAYSDARIQECLNTISPLFASLYPDTPQDELDQIILDELEDLEWLSKVAKKPNSQQMVEDAFKKIDERIREQVREQFNRMLTIPEPQQPKLNQVWHDYMPFLATTSSEHSKVQIWMIGLRDGCVYKLIESRKLQAEKVAGNFWAFMISWPQLIAPNAPKSTKDALML